MDDLRKAAQAALEALEGPLVPSPAKRHKVLAGLRAALAQPEPWRDAIDEALIVRCLEPSRDDEMPMQALWRLIAWEVTIALDPAVSERAAALLAAQPDKATEASGSNDNSGAVGSQVDRGVRPPVADKYAKAVLHADGSLHNFTLRIGGALYRCDCGCNVFHKPDRKRLDLYECNGCGSRLEASI